jgi:hypothetical protein
MRLAEFESRYDTALEKAGSQIQRNIVHGPLQTVRLSSGLLRKQPLMLGAAYDCVQPQSERKALGSYLR